MGKCMYTQDIQILSNFIDILMHNQSVILNGLACSCSSVHGQPVRKLY